LKFFTVSEAAMLDAITARILPSGSTPGAREAGVVNFIDYMLATQYVGQEAAYREGLRRLNQVAETQYKRPFIYLTPAEQDPLLAKMESGQICDWPQRSIFFRWSACIQLRGCFRAPNTTAISAESLGGRFSSTSHQELAPVADAQET
jgi:hypothetical protein